MLSVFWLYLPFSLGKGEEEEAHCYSCEGKFGRPQWQQEVPGEETIYVHAGKSEDVNCHISYIFGGSLL